MCSKRLSVALFLVLVNLFCNSNAQQKIEQKSTVAAIEKKWELTFSDEFNGSGTPDPLKWNTREYNRRNNSNGPDGWWSKEDSYMENGNLVIRVKTIPNKNDDNDSIDYSCGALDSNGKFEQLYGKFEIRCQLQKKQGWWTAFWMMQGKVNQVGNEGVDGTEVDIFEGFGWGNKLNQAIHWDGYGKDHKKIPHPVYDLNIKEGFHIFTFIWTPEVYKFYVDGVETWTTSGAAGVCNQPGHLLVTGEISTDEFLSGNKWANEPKSELFPDYFLVDWVRVYK